MFGLGIPEILFILLLATLILGPEHMPRAARMIGRWSSKLRSAATSFGNAVASDADLNEIKTGLSEVRNEIDTTKNELLAPKKEISQVSAETHEAFEKAREELKSIQAFTGRDNSCGTSESSEKKDEIEEVKPIPSCFMSRPLGSGAREIAMPVQCNGLRAVSLSKARFLPEEISRLVVRRKIELETPDIIGNHRCVALEKANKKAAFLSIRKLDMPVNEAFYKQRMVKL